MDEVLGLYFVVPDFGGLLNGGHGRKRSLTGRIRARCGRRYSIDVGTYFLCEGKNNNNNNLLFMLWYSFSKISSRYT